MEVYYSESDIDLLRISVTNCCLREVKLQVFIFININITGAQNFDSACYLEATFYIKL